MGVIDSAMKNIANSKRKNMEIHFICAGCHYYVHFDDLLKLFILERMKRYNIKAVMVTILEMDRWTLTTKECVKKYCLGNGDEKISVNDDLDSLFEDLQRGELPLRYHPVYEHYEQKVDTYFFPMLSKEELDMVERRDINYLRSFGALKPEKMEPSESNSRFVHSKNTRRTFSVTNPLYSKNGQNSFNQLITAETFNCCSLQ